MALYASLPEELPTPLKFLCVSGYYGLSNSLSTSFNPCPWQLIGEECWVFEDAGCGSGNWLSHPCGLTCWVVDLLHCSASDTSPSRGWYPWSGLVEFNEREYWIQRWLVSIFMRGRVNKSDRFPGHKVFRLESQTEQPPNSGYLWYFPLDHNTMLVEDM